ncbi:MAG: flagellar biosynthetic protein FliO [Syntrophotalea sp.]|uniref:flagellar biosynthetic protein FliO n=1 Tax=Syntrophotalea sp. TaxID=2812029 RepID=UPI003D0C75AE
MSLRFACLMILTLPFVAQAGETAALPAAGGLRMWAGLAVVMALILLLYAAAQRWLRWPTGGRSGVIRIRETRPLGPKKYLYLVQVRDRELLLGVTAERICLLNDAPLPDGDEPVDGAENQIFSQMLRKRLKERP